MAQLQRHGRHHRRQHLLFLLPFAEQAKLQRIKRLALFRIPVDVGQQRRQLRNRQLSNRGLFLLDPMPLAMSCQHLSP